MNDAVARENVAAGWITQVMGAVVDVQFRDEKELPPITWRNAHKNIQWM